MRKNKNFDSIETLDEQQSILSDLILQTEVSTKEFVERQVLNEKEQFETLGGEIKTVFDEKTKLERILTEEPISYEPRFVEFFAAFAKIENWSEETIKAYRKPHIVAETINEVIYSRFGKDTFSLIQNKNPYIAWCLRKHKNYNFLTEAGIQTLETYIDDAVTLMNDCSTLYEFRVLHSRKFGTSFQTNLFQGQVLLQVEAKL